MLLPVCCAALAIATSGCFVHRAAWNAAPEPGAAATVPEEALRRARGVTRVATDREGVERALAVWGEVASAAPGHAEAWTEQARLELLLGAAWAEGPRDQADAYRRAMRRAEGALALDPELRRRVENGSPLWEALDTLEDDDLEALNLWVTAVFYRFRDTFSSPARVLNLRWLGRARRVLDRMQELDPDWSSGALHFAWGIYYLALPEVAGGDRERSRAELDRAVELGPDWLLFRWGRGRYFHLETGDREGFRTDLEWVASRDPATAGGRPEWNVYLQREARELLADTDRLFAARD